ncbi:hypothetical protein GTA08_BOTSDO13685 [Neofusicoccum parvum]|uniref:Uncharacterized protein n=2 Tax=Neofusicoccum parvum TaxID=310453 RepID=A0ACB5SNI5_9PEZI|nr:hypothetical protein GTA08_BOTSDO13685 [Neofusicoccum parvum]
MSGDKSEGVVNVDSKPEHLLDKGLETTESEADRAEVLSAAGISLASDDADLPCLTLRMWVIGIGFCLLGSGLNTLYTFRYPSITLSQAAIQFLAFPLGRLWERVVPDWTIPIFGWKLDLNRGRFNHKENILIFIMANLSFFTRLSADVLTEQRVFYGVKCGWGFEIIITLATILFGFSLAGLCRSIIVEPPAIMWPGVFGDTALNHALHFTEKERKDSTKWKASRYTFFLIAFSISFCWYWFPDFIFPAMGYFTFVCWIAPKNAVVNQVFGMKSGIGLLPLTFDWSQIAYISSPLIAPPWAIINLLASLVFWIYIISPALYYTNTWYSAYLPIQSNSVFDNMAETYNVSKYYSYSPLYMPVTYALNMFGLSFATIPALLIWIGLEKRKELKAAFKGALNFKRHLRVEQGSDALVPTWWYLISCAISVALGMFACEYYPVQLRWYGALFAFVISSIMFVPLAMVYATTNLKINIDVFCRIVAGYVFEGKVLANVWFFDLGYISGVKGLQFAQDLKLGLYCNIPARKLFLVQYTRSVASTFHFSVENC